jgi:hypothetical protein
MRDARPLLILAGVSLALTLSACAGEQEPDENQVITDINAADPGDIEALPPDESVDPLPADNGAETGDGDDMVNVTDGNQG